MTSLSWIAATLLLGAALLPRAAGAVEPVTHHQGRFADLEAGRGAGVTLQADGALVPGPVARPLTGVAAERIWALFGDGDALWIGTGDDGRVYRLAPGADSAAVLLESPQIGIHALAGAGDGAVYAGSAPDGLVYRIDPRGQVRTVARTGSRYVWALGREADGRLVAATGLPARVLRIDPDGGTETLLDVGGEAHVRSLLRIGRRWYAGTAVTGGPPPAAGATQDETPRGRIYELAEGRARLLHETEHEEVVHLAARGDTLFAALSSAPPASGSGTGGGEPRAVLLRVEPGGAAWPIWEGTGLWAGLAAVDGALEAVLREPGRVLRIPAAGGGHVRVAHLDSLVPNAARRWRGELVVGAGLSGSLVRLSTAAADSGWFEAPAIDLGAHGRWGALTWEAEVPRGARLILRTRTGNGAVPDPTWSPWSAPLTESGAAVSSPPGRYLQVRAVLRAGGAGPRLRRISVTGRQTNRPPVIEELTTFAYRGNPQGKGPPPQAPPNGGNGPQRLPQSKSLRLVRWKAADTNGDELRYRLYLRGEGQDRWKLVEEDLEATTVVWDTETMPEGMTRLRLVATDARGNPPARALTAERTSEPFAIDNSPPVVELATRRQDGAVVVEATFTDRVGPVRGARYSIDYADQGTRLEADDGLFDGRRETARFRLADLPAGEHVISVQAWDHLDNVGVAGVRIVIGD